MILKTSRFGDIEVNEECLIRFPRGVVGFADQKEYALIQTAEDSVFYWLQSVDRPELAFVICDPRFFLPDYRVPIKQEELFQIGLTDAEGVQVFIIANRVGEELTGNLQGPLVVNVEARVAKQLVLSSKQYTPRHVLMALTYEDVAMSKTA